MSEGWAVAVSLGAELALLVLSALIFHRPGWRWKLASVALLVLSFLAFLSTVVFGV
jgi:hypothetical protein